MELHFERERERSFREREAAGENVWNNTFAPSVRTRVLLAYRAVNMPPYWIDIGAEAARELLFERMGDPRLLERANPLLGMATERAANELYAYMATCPDSMVPSVVETLMHELNVTVDALTRDSDRDGEADEEEEDDYAYEPDPNVATDFQSAVNEIFRLERVAWELVEGRMIPFQSQELHQAVVAELLRLLSGRSGWEQVEETYQKALAEIGDDPSDAITDVGTAVQDALRKLGCNGRDLAHLSSDAVRQGILKGYDTRLVDWLGADRSQSGDGHTASGANSDDAWFAVHVGGALILRLARGGPRMVSS